MFKGKRLYILVGAAVLLLPSIFALLRLYTDWLFFLETGFDAVFTTTLASKILAGIGAGLLMFGIVFANLLISGRLRFSRAEFFRQEENLYRIGRDELVRLSGPLGILAALLLALFAGQWGAAQWDRFLLFGNAVRVGSVDPILGRDLGFYLFKLPLLEFFKAYAGFALLVSAVVCTVLYYVRGGIALTDRGMSVHQGVRRHLAVLAGLFLLVMAAGFYLDCFRLLLSGDGLVYGAGYADVKVRLPVYRLLTFMTPLAGLVLAIGAWRGRWRMALAAPLAVLAVYGVGIKLYPGLLQKFKVAPNELALESPFIEHNIRFTRLGYNLDRIETIPFDADHRLTAADIAANDATIKNIRLWDHGPLLRTYSQLQQIRTYYKFFDVDNDRYTVNGRYTQVMLSPRELSYGDLPSKSWINERLIFTHGNGVAIGPVSRISAEGLPEFFVKDIPAVSLADNQGDQTGDLLRRAVQRLCHRQDPGAGIQLSYRHGEHQHHLWRQGWGSGGVPDEKGPFRRPLQNREDPPFLGHNSRKPHSILPEHQRAGQDRGPLSQVRRRPLHGGDRRRRPQMDHRRLHGFGPAPLFPAAQGGGQLHAQLGEGGG